MSSFQEIELREHETRTLPREALSQPDGEVLWQRYGTRVVVEFPSPKTAHRWHLTPGGWVGYLVVRDGLGLALQPKVPVGNLFQMLEVAYDLPLHLDDDIAELASVHDFYERLACLLARRVLQRTRRGIHREYEPHTDHLPFLRGRLELATLARRPWNPALRCQFDEHTADLEDNRILSWTLLRIARSALCGTRSRPPVVRAYRALAGAAPPEHLRSKLRVGPPPRDAAPRRLALALFCSVLRPLG